MNSNNDQQQTTLTPNNSNQNVPQQNGIIPNVPIQPIQNSNNVSTPSVQPNQSANTLIELESKDNELKTDGVVIIGNVINEDQMVAIPSAKLPPAIDVKERKKQQLKNKDNKKKTYKISKTVTPKQKGQTVVAFSALVVIVLLIAAFAYINHLRKPEEIKLNNLTIEYMEETYPKKVSKYVQTKEGEHIDELQYTLDLSEVGEEIGVYNYTVTYKGQTKTGTIEIKDSKKPDLIVRPVAIIVGESYSAYQFSSSCYDHSGCNIFFEDSSVESKYKNPGTYGPIQVSAVDAYNNKTTKEATLTILETPNIYEKFEYSEDGTYSQKTIYTLYFQDLTVNNTIVSNIFCSDTVCSSKEEIYTYNDSAVFEEEKNKHYGEIGYEINEFKQTITHTENINGVGPSQISKKENVINHLENEGFIKK